MMDTGQYAEYQKSLKSELSKGESITPQNVNMAYIEN